MKSNILLLLTLVVSAVAQNSPSETAPIVLKSEGGRYVFGQISSLRADQYLLDTKTGRLWQIVVDEKKRQKLQAVPFIGILLGEDSYLPDTDEAVIKHREIGQQAELLKLQQAIDEASKQKK